MDDGRRQHTQYLPLIKVGVINCCGLFDSGDIERLCGLLVRLLWVGRHEVRDAIGMKVCRVQTADLLVRRVKYQFVMQGEV